MEQPVVGVDGRRGGWIAASYCPTPARLTFSLHSDFSSVLQSHSEAASIAVDIPIGLTESFEPRTCDLVARRIVGPRRSSIFPAPDRRLLRFAEYAEANAFSRHVSGKGLIIQSFSIFDKIAEVDTAISPQLQARVFEVHPEVCFWAAGGQTQLQYWKRTQEGFDERRDILRAVMPGIVIPERRDAARLIRGAGSDDILDATIAAWTALRQARGQHKCVPGPDSVQLDARGIRMEMVY